MSIRTRVEDRIAAQHGVDLPWLDRVAPDVAVRWRREHDAQVHAAVIALMAAL